MQDEILKELHSVIAGNQQFTTWTVSTPHLVELVNRAVKRELESAAERAWIALVNHKQPWEVRQAVTNAITEAKP